MEDLPDLAFERIVSYLSLSDRLMSRAVSRVWRIRFDFKVKSLCCSDRPIGFIEGKRRWISGIYAVNFIGSPRFESFFKTFGPTILCDLKYLRLCAVNAKNMPAFIQALNSLGRLGELEVINYDLPSASNSEINVELNLPMLQSILLKGVSGIQKLILDTPRLWKIKLVDSPITFDLVHAESVERLISDQLEKFTPMKSLKNLLYLNIGGLYKIQPTFLSNLEQLKELHLNNLSHYEQASDLFEQKRRYGRTGLKIYRFGYLLDDPEDPSIARFHDMYFEEGFLHLAEHPTRLADEIPFSRSIPYQAIEAVTPELAADILTRFTDLFIISVEQPVADVQRLLDLLKSYENITRVRFVGDHPPELFDRLSDQCSFQWLFIVNAHPDLQFVFKLKDLIFLFLNCPMDLEFFFQAWKELPLLSTFYFKFTDKKVEIRLDHSFSTNPKPFKVSVSTWPGQENPKETDFSDLNSVIQFIGWKGGLSFIHS